MIVKRLFEIIDRLEGANSKRGTKKGAQAEFCRKTGISSAVVAHWKKALEEAGRDVEPTSVVMGKIRDAYGVSIRWIETGEGDMIDREIPLSEPENAKGPFADKYPHPLTETVTIPIGLYDEMRRLEGELRATLKQVEDLREDNRFTIEKVGFALREQRGKESGANVKEGQKTNRLVESPAPT